MKLLIPTTLLALSLLSCGGLRDDIQEAKVLLKSDHPESNRIFADAVQSKYFNHNLKDYAIDKGPEEILREGMTKALYLIQDKSKKPKFTGDGYQRMGEAGLIAIEFDTSKYSLDLKNNSDSYREIVQEFEESDPSLVGSFAAGLGRKVNRQFIDSSIVTSSNLELKLREDSGDGLLISNNGSLTIYDRDTALKNPEEYKRKVKDSDLSIQLIRLINHNEIDVPEGSYSMPWYERGALVLDESGKCLFLNYGGLDFETANITLRQWSEIVQQTVKENYPHLKDYTALYLECGTHGFFAYRNKDDSVRISDRGLMPATQIDVRKN